MSYSELLDQVTYVATCFCTLSVRSLSATSCHSPSTEGLLCCKHFSGSRAGGWRLEQAAARDGVRHLGVQLCAADLVALSVPHRRDQRAG